jgi:hypothetical protein
MFHVALAKSGKKAGKKAPKKAPKMRKKCGTKRQRLWHTLHELSNTKNVL